MPAIPHQDHGQEPLTMLEHCAEPFSEETIREWREKGYIDKDVDVTLRWLMDVACGRADFVFEIHDHTSAWNELISACRELHALGLDDSQEGGHAWGSLTRHQQLTADWWLKTNDVDVPWMREWVERVVFILPSLLENPDDDSDIFLVFMQEDEDGYEFHPEGSLPIPNMNQVMFRSRAFEWKGDEVPPLPHLETYEEFMERMKEAWRARVALLRESNCLPAAAHASTPSGSSVSR